MSTRKRPNVQPVVPSDHTRNQVRTHHNAIARVGRSKRDAIRWYDRLSPWYGSTVARLDERPRNRGVELLDLQPGERVHEIGSGPGTALVQFAEEVGQTGHVTGLDISSGMCGVARETVREAGVESRVSIVRGDAEHLPFEAGAFDAIFTSFTLELFDSPALPAVLGECRRVLGEDGRLGVVALSKRDAGLTTRAYERVHELLPKYADCRPIFARELLDESKFDVETAETWPLWGLAAEVVIARS